LFWEMKKPVAVFRRGLRYLRWCQYAPDLPDASSGRSKQIQIERSDIEMKSLGRGWRTPAVLQSARRTSMYFVAAVLAVLSGLFYAAGRHEIGSLGVTMCQYGSPFCDNPLLVLVAAGLAACWGVFVSVR
jgi:hypothetical protein